MRYVRGELRTPRSAAILGARSAGLEPATF
jgi:hypothetical protein